jgi:hypothetical protein
VGGFEEAITDIDVVVKVAVVLVDVLDGGDGLAPVDPGVVVRIHGVAARGRALGLRFFGSGWSIE